MCSYKLTTRRLFKHLLHIFSFLLVLLLRIWNSWNVSWSCSGRIKYKLSWHLLHCCRSLHHLELMTARLTTKVFHLVTRSRFLWWLLISYLETYRRDHTTSCTSIWHAKNETLEIWITSFNCEFNVLLSSWFHRSTITSLMVTNFLLKNRHLLMRVLVERSWYLLWGWWI